MLVDECLPFEIFPSLDCPYPGTCVFDSDLPTVGLKGMLAWTSFAYTNGELSGLVILMAGSIDALDLHPGGEILSPSPLEARTSCEGVSRFSIEEIGLELLGVPSEVPFGVDDALSTLAFLEPDRGVILELKKALTGVATSSGECPVSTPDRSTRLRRVEDLLMAEGAVVRGVPLLLPAHLGDCEVVFATGRRLTMAFCLSEFITAAPCRVRVAEWLCGELAMSFLAVLRKMALTMAIR